MNTVQPSASLGVPTRPRADGVSTSIKHMVDRFLMWRLPESFRPDGGISFKAAFNEDTPHPMTHKPVGTNLFSATEAEAMVRHMVESMMPVAWRVYDKANDGYFVTDNRSAMNGFLGSAGFEVEALYPLISYDDERRDSEGRS